MRIAVPVEENEKEICKAADIRLTHEEWYSLYFAAGNTLP